MPPDHDEVYLSRLGEAGKPLEPRVTSEIENHFGFLESELGGQPYFMGNDLSAVDVHLSFPIQTCKLMHGLGKLPALAGFLERAHARPAYRRAIERGGAYAFGS
jgi:glutathione S-transferase